jgi:lipopolysaccharide/colanic/teichoic acid biosynthesis glycosyltransferase
VSPARRAARAHPSTFRPGATMRPPRRARQLPGQGATHLRRPWVGDHERAAVRAPGDAHLSGIRRAASRAGARGWRAGGREGDTVGAWGFQRAVKRGVDVVGAALLLAACLPVLTIAAAAIAVEDGRPVLFFQQRAGRSGRPFTLVKLRTLQVNRIAPEDLGQVRAGNALALRAGAVLRRLKIDELPQLWNVLVGDMSLVGPRPTLPEQAARYDAVQARRLEVRPGLSGWAQVNGNVELAWEERILLDVWYVDHFSLLLDARILAATLRVVLFGEKRDPAALAEASQHACGVGRSR